MANWKLFFLFFELFISSSSLPPKQGESRTKCELMFLLCAWLYYCSICMFVVYTMAFRELQCEQNMHIYYDLVVLQREGITHGLNGEIGKTFWLETRTRHHRWVIWQRNPIFGADQRVPRGVPLRLRRDAKRKLKNRFASLTSRLRVYNEDSLSPLHFAFTHPRAFINASSHPTALRSYDNDEHLN